MKSGKANVNTILVIAVSLIVFAIGSWSLFQSGWKRQAAGENLTQPQADVTETQPGRNTEPSKFPVTINQPSGAPRVATGQFHATGEPITVACSTCHSVRPPNFDNKSATELNEFHSGMVFAHGTLACLSCHNPDDYDTLKLASGESVNYPDVMTLCGQCHGTQMRDYRNGAHGGMNGYWDLKRGPRNRNNCIDCHDPHAPKFPQMKPTFKPRDRFLEPPKSGEH